MCIPSLIFHPLRKLGLAMQLKDIIYQKERSLLTAKNRASSTFIKDHLTEDFTEFASSGVIHSLADVIQWLQNSESFVFEISSFDIQLLSDSVVLATYIFKVKDSLSRRSSIWVLQDNVWKMKFHQGTRIPAL